MNRIAGYVRLSRDEDKKEYASIEAQKKIIIDFVITTNIGNEENINFYEDDNISGYTFERPSMKQLLEDVENNKIDIILVKDISRIGRHNAKTLLFIEDINRLKKRIIAINDNYDSFKDSDEILGIKTWYNERYIKDLSKKIRTNIRIYMKENTYINTIPYGYKKENKQIIIDTEAAEIVKMIFDLYINGYGYYKIAKLLSDENIPSPYEYYKQTKKSFKSVNIPRWHENTIQSIISNDFYIGTRRQGKTTSDGINGKKILRKKEEQFVFKNVHPAIISEELFNLVHQIKNKRLKFNYKGQRTHENVFSGILICGDCYKLMTPRKERGKYYVYCCSTHKHFGKEVCTMHYTRQDYLFEYVKDIIRNLKTKIENDFDKIENNIMNSSNIQKNYEASINNLKKDLECLKLEHKTLLSQKIKALIKNPDNETFIEEQYTSLENDISTKIQIMESQVDKMTKLKYNYENVCKNVSSTLDILDNMLTCEEIGKSSLEYIFNKIIINQDKNIIAEFNDNIAYLFPSDRKTVEEQDSTMHFITAANYLSQINKGYN